jgi:ABC-2 type transport system permease protein
VTPYLAILAARFRALLQYRAAAVGGVFTQTFFGFMRIMILEAFYASSAAPQPLGPAAMVGYIWLGQATYAMFPLNVDPDVRAAVRSGDIVYELCRPLGQYGLWFSRCMAWRTAPLLLRLVPMLLFAMLVLPLVGLGEWRLAPPPSLASAAAALAAMLGALVLSCALTTLMNISLLWTVSGQGVASLTSGLAALLGGLIIPLPLFPDWAQPIIQSLPFAGVLDLPARVYTGGIAPDGVAWVLGRQVAWIAALVALGHLALARGTRRLVVQGG